MVDILSVHEVETIRTESELGPRAIHLPLHVRTLCKSHEALRERLTACQLELLVRNDSPSESGRAKGKTTKEQLQRLDAT